MKHVARTVIMAGSLAVVAALAVAGAGLAQSGKKAGGGDVCVLLPDPKTSVRWETQDRPAFIAAFKKANVSYIINNANGDAQRQRSQADQCLGSGAKVLILISLDAGSSIAIESAAPELRVEVQTRGDAVDAVSAERLAHVVEVLPRELLRVVELVVVDQPLQALDCAAYVLDRRPAVVLRLVAAGDEAGDHRPERPDAETRLHGPLLPHRRPLTSGTPW